MCGDSYKIVADHKIPVFLASHKNFGTQQKLCERQKNKFAKPYSTSLSVLHNEIYIIISKHISQQ